MKNKDKLYIRELQLQIANERIKELEHDKDMLCKTAENLEQQIALKEKVNKVFADVNADLSKSIDSKNKLLDHYEQTIRSCEDACIYHQKRSEKAFEILGRTMVDGEME